MARLPVVGGDRDNWGVVLNDYLSVEHNADGTLKLRTDGSLSNNIADGSVTASKLSSTVNSYLASAQTAVQSVNGESGQAITLTAADISGAVQSSQLGAVSGVATLDGSSKLTAGQVPDNVITGSAKRALAIVASPYSVQYTLAELALRVPLGVNVTSIRWRLRIRNINILTNTPTLAGAGFVASYIGEQAFASDGTETPDFAAAPLQCLPGFTLASDGSEYVSDWVAAENLQLVAKKSYILSTGWTGGGTMNWGTTRCWYKTNSSSEAGNTTVSGYTAFHQCPLDIRLEYDTIDTTGLRVAVIGDSTSHGCGNNITMPVAHQRRWPELWGCRLGHMAANGGIASSSVGGLWADDQAWAYQRFLPGDIAYDAVIEDLGVNDVSGSVALFQANYKNMIANIRSVFGSSTAIYANGVKPYDLHTHAVLEAPAAISDTTIKTSISFNNAIELRIGNGYKTETVTTVGTSTGSAPGPYTTTITAGLTKTHLRGEIIAGVALRNRQDFNTHKSKLPDNITGFNPTHLAVEAPYDSGAWNPELCSDGIHPNVAGHAAIQLSVGDIDKRSE